MNPSTNLKNNFYFKRILKYCSLGIRSNFEIKKKLESFENITDELSLEIKDFFVKIKVVLPDEDYINYYLDNLSGNKGYSYNQLYLKLSRKVEDQSLLRNILKKYFKETENTQIEKFVSKNLRKLLRMDSNAKRLNYLVQKGFSYDLSKNLIKNLTYNTKFD